jgi:beta-xylosidase
MKTTSCFQARLAGVVTLLISAACCIAADKTSSSLVTTYTNPIRVRIADPMVLKEGPTYYLYGTTNPGDGFMVYTSDDLVNWTNRGPCYNKDEDTWGQWHFWAPEVVKKDGTYFLYYSGFSPKANQLNVCVATSTSPLGMFRDAKAPFIPNMDLIDAHVFQDPAAPDKYYYFVKDNLNPSRILVAPLAPSLLELETTLTEVLKLDQKWEDWVIEAPYVVLHNGWYYMMSSGSAWNEPLYAVGYAVAKSPMGPWKKFEGNPILKQAPGMEGPGHNGVALAPDGRELFMVYHVHAGPWTVVRELAIDRIKFVPQAGGGPDLLTVPDGPSSTPQPRPSGAKPMQLGRSDEFNSSSLDRSLWTFYNEDPKFWRLENGSLIITTQEFDTYSTRDDQRNVFLQYPPEGDLDIETLVEIHAERNHENAALMVWDGPDNYVKFGPGYNGRPMLAAGFETYAKYHDYYQENDLGPKVYLRISRRGHTYRFFASNDEKTWVEVGVPYEFPRENTMIGLTAGSPSSGRAIDARFEYFRVKSVPGTSEKQSR